MIFRLLIVIIVCLSLCSGVVIGQKIKGSPFTLKNDLPEARANEVAVFTKTAFTSLTGPTITGQYPIITTTKGKALPSQIDDLDGDGVWDEIAILVNIPANSTIKLLVNYSRKKPKYQQLAHSRLGKSERRDDLFKQTLYEVRPANHKSGMLPLLYQMEGPAIENNRVAFRSFFDERNSKGVFGKVVPKMILDSVGIGQDYDKMQSWGRNVLEVGSSMGAGGLGLIDITNDSTYRLGKTEEATCKLVSDGPIRSIIQLKYTGWKVKGQSLILTETMILPANSYTYESRVKIEGNGNNNLKLIAGVTKRTKVAYNASMTNESIYEYSFWERQSATNDFLGLAILADVKFNPDQRKLKTEDTNSSSGLVVLENFKDEYQFYFCAAWEKSDALFSTKRGFYTHTKALADRLANPIKLSK